MLFDVYYILQIDEFTSDGSEKRCGTKQVESEEGGSGEYGFIADKYFLSESVVYPHKDSNYFYARFHQ